MGWGRTLLLGDVGNRLDIADCEEEIASLSRRMHSQRRTDRSQDARIGALERENGELKLYLASFVRLMIAKGAISADEFARFVDIVDESDGSADGQFTGSIAE